MIFYVLSKIIKKKFVAIVMFPVIIACLVWDGLNNELADKIQKTTKSSRH